MIRRFEDLKKIFSRCEPVSIVERSTGYYETYLTIDDVPEEYDDYLVLGIGLAMEELDYGIAEKPKGIRLQNCLEIVVSEDPEEKDLTAFVDIENIGYPQYFPRYKEWGIPTDKGLKCGRLEFILGFIYGNDLPFLYRYKLYNHIEGSVERYDAKDLFSEIMEVLISEPEKFSIEGFEEDYSEQERHFLRKAQKALICIKNKETGVA